MVGENRGNYFFLNILNVALVLVLLDRKNIITAAAL